MTVLSKKALEHKREYNRKRTKEHYKSFSVNLKKEEYEQIVEYLKAVGMNKAECIRWAFDKIREG